MSPNPAIASRTVKGWVAPGFECVKAEFERNFRDRGEVGAAFAAVCDGTPVVDLWGGLADAEEQRPWEQDTVAVIFSGTKGLVALCMNMLLDRGRLDADAPVCRYWPEFAAHGKERILVRDVLTHQARLPGIRDRVAVRDLLDDVRMADRLARQPPEADPRARFSYHALTFGWLCGELVRRVDGRSVGRFFADEVARPLRVPIWIGLPPEIEPLVARLSIASGCGRSPGFDPAQRAGDVLFQSVWGNPPLFQDPLFWNTRAVRAAEIPGAGGVASARAMARLYGALASGGALEGVRLLSGPALDRARRQQVCAYEELLEAERAYALGFAVKDPEDTELGPPADAFGHGGAGGSRHGAWPSLGVGFSYVMNQMRDDDDDQRGTRLLGALHSVASDGRQTIHMTKGRV